MRPAPFVFDKETSMQRYGLFALALSLTLHAQMVPVLTRAYDNNRTGANLQETKLTQQSVRSGGMRRVTTIPVFGDARGIEAQPLILPGVQTTKGTRDVMVLPSMANVVRGVDATTGEDIWQANLGRPINGSAAIDMHTINDKWGVLSTGVIDADTQRVYMVSWVSPDGTAKKGEHFINVLTVADGKPVVPPIALGNARSGTQVFKTMLRKQRSSLLMTKVNGRKTIFFASGTVLETEKGAAGWIFAIDVATNKLAASMALSQGHGAGVWMAGQGLAADKDGFLYGVSGNGSFNGTSDFGETVFKVQYTPASGNTAAQLKVVSRWSPYSDAARMGLKPTLASPRMAMRNKLSGVSAPSEQIRMPVNGMKARALEDARVVTNNDENTGKPVELVYPKLAAQNPAFADEDLGSAGGTLIEPYMLYLAAGKDGIGYVVKAGSMGDTKLADFANMKANCAKLASPPVWLTASPGPVDPCPQDMTTLNFMPWGKTRHMHSTPVQYWSADGLKLFVWGENSQLHEWAMSPQGKLTYVAQSNEIASANSVNSPGGMPGGFCTLSSNDNKPGTALLWCTIPYGDANTTVTNGRLLCYDPDHAVNGVIPVLWDSQQWGIDFTFNKFLPPIVDGGQVYVANYSGGVDVYAP
jgi:hypothetical protein